MAGVAGPPHQAGTIFAGVGLGIAAAGLFCLIAARPEVSSLSMWIELGNLAGITRLFPLVVTRRLSALAASAGGTATPGALHKPLPTNTSDLIVCYTLFGFGYFLPATYLPAQAWQLVDDPQIFGLAWPLFGTVAALSTIVVAWG